MRIGVLTGGGDCPGLNAVIRAVVRRAEVTHDAQVVGFLDGWKGLVEDRSVALDVERCRGLLPKGGTVLGTSRGNPLTDAAATAAVEATIARHGIDALIAIGGEGTMGVTRGFFDRGLPVVGVPKTIDNDIPGTDLTFGFTTAVQVAVDAIDRLHTTAESHDRVLVCEVMGRHAGWIATHAAIAGGAAALLVPERPFDIGAISRRLSARHERGRWASIVVVAEGAFPDPASDFVLPAPTIDAYGHARLGGTGQLVAEEIERRTGFDTRVTTLGHTQRGGTPTALDRVLATRFGVAAADAVHEGRFGEMVALRGPDVVLVPLGEAFGGRRTVDLDLVAIADLFGG